MSLWWHKAAHKTCGQIETCTSGPSVGKRQKAVGRRFAGLAAAIVRQNIAGQYGRQNLLDTFTSATPETYYVSLKVKVKIMSLIEVQLR